MGDFKISNGVLMNNEEYIKKLEIENQALGGVIRRYKKQTQKKKRKTSNVEVSYVCDLFKMNVHTDRARILYKRSYGFYNNPSSKEERRWL